MRQRRDVQVRQDGINFVNTVPMNKAGQITAPFIAQVTNVYSERMTCDVKTVGGQDLFNIPVLTEAGLVDGEVYGTFNIPAVDDYVLVMFASYGERHKVIVGTVVPYLTSEFTGDAVNSGSKQFTLKLLEADKPHDYRKVFKSGTTFHVEEDGTVVLETPTGAYVRFSEADEEIKLEDPHGNVITIDSAGIVITDANGNTFTLDSSGVAIDDANGNNVTMGAASVTINGNLEVLQ